jgi:hypothetical protein
VPSGVNAPSRHRGSTATLRAVDSPAHAGTSAAAVFQQKRLGDTRLLFAAAALALEACVPGQPEADEAEPVWKERNPKLKVVLVDPFGSGLYCWVREGKVETTGSSITEGIGIMRLTENFKRARVDEAMRVSDQQMIEMLYHLAREDALVVGTSAALNVRAAYEVAKQQPNAGLNIVTFLCDHGSRYFSKVFNADFLASKGLSVAPLS